MEQIQGLYNNNQWDAAISKAEEALAFDPDNADFNALLEQCKNARDLEGKIVVGEFANYTKDEFTDNIDKISVEKSGKKTVINSAYESEL